MEQSDRAQKKGNYLLREERSAFLLWLRLVIDDAAENLWHETEDMLKVLNMDFPEHLTKIMLPLFSRRDVAVIFEVVDLPHSAAPDKGAPDSLSTALVADYTK